MGFPEDYASLEAPRVKIRGRWPENGTASCGIVFLLKSASSVKSHRFELKWRPFIQISWRVLIHEVSREVSNQASAWKSHRKSKTAVRICQGPNKVAVHTGDISPSRAIKMRVQNTRLTCKSKGPEVFEQVTGRKRSVGLQSKPVALFSGHSRRVLYRGYFWRCVIFDRNRGQH